MRYRFFFVFGEQHADVVDRIARLANIKLTAVASLWSPMKDMDDLNTVYSKVTHVITQWQSMHNHDQPFRVAVDCTPIGKKSLHVTLSQACRFRRADAITFDTSKSEFFNITGDDFSIAQVSEFDCGITEKRKCLLNQISTFTTSFQVGKNIDELVDLDPMMGVRAYSSR